MTMTTEPLESKRKSEKMESTHFNYKRFSPYLFYLFADRCVERAKIHIQKILNVYGIFGWINLGVLLVMPIFQKGRNLAFNLWLPYDPFKTNLAFYLTYFHEFGCVIYAGGSNIAINLYVFSILICLNFYVTLLNERVKRIGYANGYNDDSKSTQFMKTSFYREIIDRITLHLKIDEYIQLQMEYNRSNCFN